jgi:hypothetical protein
MKKKLSLPKKRVFVDLESFKESMGHEIPVFFSSFEKAYDSYENKIKQTTPSSRVRGYEAMVLNTEIVQHIQKSFPLNFKRGKYKRILFDIGNYIILIKKYDKNGRPMNIPTKSTKNISNQSTLPLFDDDSNSKPIIYFGYSLDRTGHLLDTKFTYIYNEKVVFRK